MVIEEEGDICQVSHRHMIAYDQIIMTRADNKRKFANQWLLILFVNQALNEVAKIKINAWSTSFERVNLKPSLCKPFSQHLSQRNRGTVDAVDLFFRSCSGLCLLAKKTNSGARLTCHFSENCHLPSAFEHWQH
jgi:hypothetical protein